MDVSLSHRETPTCLAASVSERSPLLDRRGAEHLVKLSRRRGGCSRSCKDKQADEAIGIVIEQPPRRFAPPLLSRRGDRSLTLSAKYANGGFTAGSPRRVRTAWLCDGLQAYARFREPGEGLPQTGAGP